MINPSVCVCVCLSASISLEPLDRSSRNFVHSSPVAVARFSSGGVALRYVLPVLWMTSRLAAMGGMALRSRPDLLLGLAAVRTRPGRSLMSMNACLSYVVYIPPINCTCLIRDLVFFTYGDVQIFCTNVQILCLGSHGVHCLLRTLSPITAFQSRIVKSLGCPSDAG